MSARSGLPDAHRELRDLMLHEKQVTPRWHLIRRLKLGARARHHEWSSVEHDRLEHLLERAAALRKGKDE